MKNVIGMAVCLVKSSKCLQTSWTYLKNIGETLVHFVSIHENVKRSPKTLTNTIRFRENININSEMISTSWTSVKTAIEVAKTLFNIVNLCKNCKVPKTFRAWSNQKARLWRNSNITFNPMWQGENLRLVAM